MAAVSMRVELQRLNVKGRLGLLDEIADDDLDEASDELDETTMMTLRPSSSIHPVTAKTCLAGLPVLSMVERWVKMT